MFSLATPSLTAPVVQDGSLLQRTDLWRATELAVSRSYVGSTGFPSLDAELPGHGWPRSAMTELLLQQAGVGEMQLLQPAMAKLSNHGGRIALVAPPYSPHTMACRSWGLRESNLFWVKTETSADSLWCAEQILKGGAFSAVVLWAKNIRTDSLRRLNLAAQSAETWFWLVRPLSVRADASPAPLRLALKPAQGGTNVDIVKRRGPHFDGSLFIPLTYMPAGRAPVSDHETHIQRAPATTAARDTAPQLV